VSPLDAEDVLRRIGPATAIEIQRELIDVMIARNRAIPGTPYVEFNCALLVRDRRALALFESGYESAVYFLRGRHAGWNRRRA